MLQRWHPPSSDFVAVARLWFHFFVFTLNLPDGRSSIFFVALVVLPVVVVVVVVAVVVVVVP